MNTRKGVSNGQCKSSTQYKLNRRKVLAASASVAFASLADLSWPGSAQAAGPKRGGTARIGFNGASTNDSLDPAKNITGFMYMTSRTLRNNLTEVAPDGQLIPELAESWEPGGDLKTWVFKIRKGVEFHNGKTLSAADVVASINHHRGKESRSSARAYLTSVDDVAADGPNAVVFKLNTPNADLPFILSDMRLPIMPADASGQADISGAGSGAYKLERFEPGVRVSTKRNPNYWKSGRAHFDGVEIVAINDTTARASALRSGSIDIMNKCDPKTFSLLAKTKGIGTVELPTAQHCIAAMMCTAAPFTNVDVRLAMKYAINRKSIVDATLFGHGLPGDDHPIGPTYKYYAKDIKPRPYDPERARFHLKKVGLDKLEVKLHTATLDFPGANDAAVLMKEHARKAGIDIAVQQEPNDGYYANVWKKVPWCMSASIGRPVESLIFATTYSIGANSNETFWSNERFMTLHKEALGTIDESKRREMYREMQMLIRDDGGAIIYQFQNTLDAHTTKIAHADRVSNNGELDGFRAAERWWFA